MIKRAVQLVLAAIPAVFLWFSLGMFTPTVAVASPVAIGVQDVMFEASGFFVEPVYATSALRERSSTGWESVFEDATDTLQDGDDVMLFFAAFIMLFAAIGIVVKMIIWLI